MEKEEEEETYRRFVRLGGLLGLGGLGDLEVALVLEEDAALLAVGEGLFGCGREVSGWTCAVQALGERERERERDRTTHPPTHPRVLTAATRCFLYAGPFSISMAFLMACMDMPLQSPLAVISVLISSR